MLKPLKNNHGLVLIIVLMIIIVMATLTISLLSINISQVQVAEQEVRRMQSETMATGMADLMFARQQSGLPTTPMSEYYTQENTTYSSSASMTPQVVNPPLMTDTINGTVNF